MNELSVAMSKLPKELTKHICTIREASMDTEHHIPMVNSDFPVVNFDAVKDTYNKKLKSNDALFVDSRYRIFFIEFKNGTIDDIKNIELYEKIYGSINILSDIFCKEKTPLISVNPISHLKNFCTYILVYNDEKVDQEHLTERTKAGLNRQNVRFSQIGIKKHLGKKSNKEIILFGLDFFRGYLFCNVHTYTVSEFQKNKLTQWENEKSLPLNKS
mgnify:FL=1